MAKIIKDENGNPVKLDSRGVPKKNRHALKCCLSFVIVWVVIIGIGIGGAFFFGDMLIKNATDGEVKFVDVVGAYTRLKNYRKVEKKQLNNGFGDSDSQEFIDSLADAILVDNIEMDEVIAIIDSLTGGLFGEETVTFPGSDEQGEMNHHDRGGINSDNDTDDDDDNDDDDDDSDDSDLMEKLKEIMLREGNLNKEKLASYTDDNIDQFYVRISDKSVAAFLNNILLNRLLDSSDLRTTIQDGINDAVSDLSLGDDKNEINIDDIDFKNLLQIKQVTFYSTGSGENKQAGVKVITGTNIKKMVDSVIGKMTGESLLRKEANSFAKLGIDITAFFAKTLINSILPAKLYVIADIPATGGTPSIRLNSTSDKDYETLGKLNDNLKETLDEIFGKDGTLDGMVGTANDILPLADSIVTSGNSGTLTCDLIAIMLNAFDVGESEQPITSKEVYLTLRTLVCADMDMSMESKQTYDYTKFDFKRNVDGSFELDSDGLPIPVPASGEIHRDPVEIQKDYEAALLVAFTKYYGLKEGTEFDTVFDMMTGEGNSEEFTDLFDAALLKEIIKGEAKGVKITPRMLAAIIAKRMERFVGEDNEDAESITPRYVILSKADYNGQPHSFMEVGVEFDLTKMMDKYADGGTSDLLGGLLAGKLLLVAKIDITIFDDMLAPAPSAEDDENDEDKNNDRVVDERYAPTRISLDRLTFDETDRISRLLDVFGISSGDGGFKGLVEDILLPVRDIIINMSNALPGLTVGESDLILPDVFAAIAGILSGESEGEKVDGNALKENLEFLLDGYTFDPFAVDKTGLVGELNDKYATELDNDQDNALSPLFEAFGITQSEDDNINEFTDIVSELKLKAILKGGKAPDELLAEIDGEMFAALIYEYRETDSGESLRDFIEPNSIKSVKFFVDSDDREFMLISIESTMEKLMEYGDGNSFSDFMCSLVDIVYMTITIDITDGDGDRKDTTVTINGTNGTDEQEKTEKLFDMLDTLSSGFRNKVLDGIVNDIDVSVRNMFGNMKDSGAKAKVVGDILTLSDLFTITAVGFNEGRAEGDQLDADDIRDVLAALHIDTPLGHDVDFKWFEFNNADSDVKMDATTLIDGKLTEGMITSIASGTSGGIDILDTEIAALLFKSADSPDGFPSGLQAVNILAKSDNGVNAMAYRGWLGEFETMATGDYITVVMNVESSRLGNLDSAAAAKFMPSNIYVTFVFAVDGNQVDYKFYRINNMSDSVQENMFKFAGDNVSEDVFERGGQNNEGNSAVSGNNLEEKVQGVFTAIDTGIKTKIVAGSLGQVTDTSEIENSFAYAPQAAPTTDYFGKMVITISLLS